MTEKPPPLLDLSAISFPTNRVTIAQMRREQPDLFNDAEAMRDSHFRQFNISATIATEVAVAEYAFAKALDLPNPDPAESQRERTSWLNQDYRRYGISTGIQATRQLVRDLENAAIAQARQYRARS